MADFIDNQALESDNDEEGEINDDDEGKSL